MPGQAMRNRALPYQAGTWPIPYFRKAEIVTDTIYK